MGGHESEVLRSGTGVLVKGPESFVALLPPGEDSMRRRQSVTRKRASSEPNLAGTPISDFLSPARGGTHFR